MNFLAHLYFADNYQESILGNLLGDFVNGSIARLEAEYGKEIAKGIKQHRLIDKYTITHTAFKSCKQLLFHKHRHFSAIIVDVLFDHYLTIHWPKFSEVSLDNFINNIHAQLSNVDKSPFPERFQRFLYFFVKLDILHSYTILAGVHTALKRIDKRFSRPTTLTQAESDLIFHYHDMEKHFLCFFKDLCLYLKNLVISQ